MISLVFFIVRFLHDLCNNIFACVFVVFIGLIEILKEKTKTLSKLDKSHKILGHQQHRRGRDHRPASACQEAVVKL